MVGSNELAVSNDDDSTQIGVKATLNRYNNVSIQSDQLSTVNVEDLSKYVVISQIERSSVDKIRQIKSIDVIQHTQEIQMFNQMINRPKSEDGDYRGGNDALLMRSKENLSQINLSDEYQCFVSDPTAELLFVGVDAEDMAMFEENARKVPRIGDQVTYIETWNVSKGKQLVAAARVGFKSRSAALESIPWLSKFKGSKSNKVFAIRSNTFGLGNEPLNKVGCMMIDDGQKSIDKKMIVKAIKEQKEINQQMYVYVSKTFENNKRLVLVYAFGNPPNGFTIEGKQYELDRSSKHSQVKSDDRSTKSNEEGSIDSMVAINETNKDGKQSTGDQSQSQQQRRKASKTSNQTGGQPQVASVNDSTKQQQQVVVVSTARGPADQSNDQLINQLVNQSKEMNSKVDDLTNRLIVLQQTIECQKNENKQLVKEVNELKARLSKIEGETKPIAAAAGTTSGSGSETNDTISVPTTPVSTPKKAATTSSNISSSTINNNDNGELKSTDDNTKVKPMVMKNDTKVKDESNKATVTSAIKQPTSLLCGQPIGKIDYEMEYKKEVKPITTRLVMTKDTKVKDESNKAMATSTIKQPTSLFDLTTMKIDYKMEYKMADLYVSFVRYLVHKFRTGFRFRFRYALLGRLP